MEKSLSYKFILKTIFLVKIVLGPASKMISSVLEASGPGASLNIPETMLVSVSVTH